MSEIKNYEFILKYPTVVTARSLKEAKEILDEEVLVHDFSNDRLEASDMKLGKISKASRKEIRDFKEVFEEDEED